VPLLYNSNCTFGLRRCFVINVAVPLLLARAVLSLPSTHQNYIFRSRFDLGLIPFLRLSRFLFFFPPQTPKNFFIPVCCCAVAFGVHLLNDRLQPRRPVIHAPSTASNTPPSCSWAVASLRQVQVYDAVRAKAYLLPTNDGYSEIGAL
jgi:hypothetical protein